MNSSRQPRSAPPAPLHFVRLAAGSPGVWVALPGDGPGGGLRVIQLVGSVSMDASGWLLCLKGEVVIDLPDGDFVRLRAGEGYQLSTSWAVLPTRDGTTLLLMG